MPPLEGNEEKRKRRKRNPSCNSKQTINQISCIITTKKAGNNSYKLKIKIRQILYLLYQHNKTKKINFRTISSSHDNNVSTYWGQQACNKTRTQNFLFWFTKNVVQNFKHKTDSMTKHNECLAEHTTKNEIRQLLSKHTHKHANNIHENREQ